MLSGSQGIGKTTALSGLAALGETTALVISIDDFYLTLGEREASARATHPLCGTRGPPGSHDLGLLNAKLNELMSASPATTVQLPRFDKRTDDRMASKDWRSVPAQPRLIVLEGWLVGALPDSNAAAAPPINELERTEDSSGDWRAWQEQYLQSAYATLWDKCDSFFHLDAPSFDVVLEWRCQQEETTLGLEPGSLPEARRQWVTRFIQHYERISRRLLAGHRRPGAALRVGRNREPIAQSKQ